MNTKTTQEHSVPKGTDAQRLQEYGVALFPAAATKSALKKALKRGLITVNGQPATSAAMVAADDRIVFRPPEIPTAKTLDLPLDVLFEDDHLAVVRKPAGLLVSGNAFRTVANALPANLQPSPAADAIRPQPAHRLDYATSGVLLVGKTASALRDLNRLFAERAVSKEYRAVTTGSMEPEGVVNLPVDGKPARSEYAVLQSVKSERFGCLNIVALRPHTGRRHQLRKHLAALGHPILGDREYTPAGQLLNGKGLYLHAYALRFEHPATGRGIYVEAPLPAKFGRLFTVG